MTRAVRANRHRRRCVGAAGERTAGARKARGGQSRLMDAMFLRQAWAGNEALLMRLLEDAVAGRPGAAALLPDQQGSVVAPGSQPRRFSPASRRRSRARRTSIRPARPKRRSRSGSRRCRPTSARRPRGFFTTIRRAAPALSAVCHRPLQPRVSGRAGRWPRASCVRPRR